MCNASGEIIGKYWGTDSTESNDQIYLIHDKNHFDIITSHEPMRSGGSNKRTKRKQPNKQRINKSIKRSANKNLLKKRKMN